MIWLSALFFPFFVFSQEVSSIKGNLLERGTRKPLKDVSLFILPHKLKAVSDEKGDFQFTDVPKGECELIVNLAGYKKFVRQSSCENVDNLKIYLEKVFYTSFETTVTGRVKKRDDQAQSLTQEEFIKAPGSFGGDPVRAAQNLPGVAAQSGNAQIIVQGASPDDTGYVINGHRVPIVFHFGGLSSVIVPEAVDRVDLLPAGYGPEYSRAIGGIVGLTTTNPKEDRLHGMAFVDLLNAGGVIQGPINKKSSFLIGGRYSYIGQVLKAVAQENDNFELTAAPTYYDLTGIYKNKLDEKNDFKTTFVLSKDELDLILNRPANNDPGIRGDLYNRTEFFRLIPSLTTRINEKTRIENSIGVGRDNLLVNLSGRYLDVQSNVISHRSEIQNDWSETYKTYIGLDNNWDKSKVRVNLPTRYSVGGVSTPFSVGEERKFDTIGEDGQFGFYFRQEIKTDIDSEWTYLPNLRLDYYTLTKETSVQPRLQLRYQWDPSLQLRGAFGKYSQAPLPQEVSKEYGNSAIEAPYAWHYVVGYRKDFRKEGAQGLEFTNNFFYKDLQNLVVPDITERYTNGGSGTIYGGEVQAKYRWSEWTSQLVYTYLNSVRRIPGFGTQPSEYDQTHNLNLIGSYNKERWTFSGRFRFVTGLPYTPVTGATFDADNDVFIPITGRIYSQRFEAFNQLDIRIDRKYIYDEWILTAYLDVQNMLNSKNSQNIQYSYDYSQKKKVRGLPILPTIGIKGEF
jgi:CarboxypepD_reg-like domain/TonB-dependent Receptor Plug Domain